MWTSSWFSQGVTWIEPFWTRTLPRKERLVFTVCATVTFLPNVGTHRYGNVHPTYSGIGFRWILGLSTYVHAFNSLRCAFEGPHQMRNQGRCAFNSLPAKAPPEVVSIWFGPSNRFWEFARDRKTRARWCDEKLSHVWADSMRPGNHTRGFMYNSRKVIHMYLDIGYYDDVVEPKGGFLICPWLGECHTLESAGNPV